MFSTETRETAELRVEQSRVQYKGRYHSTTQHSTVQPTQPTMLRSIKPIHTIKPLAALRHSSSIPKLATTPNKFNSRSSAFNLVPRLPDGLFFHPAPAGLNPEITPSAFLPETDARKTSEVYYPEQRSYITANLQHMPVITKIPTPKNYAHTSETVQQLQQMRDEGATRMQMKQKFNVTDHFISLTTTPNDSTISKQSKKLKNTARRWSEKTKKARQARELRKLQWERDI